MASDIVELDVAGTVATVWLNNPPVNAVSMRMLHALSAALDTVEREPSIRCAILAGRGERAFCAGADLRAEGGPGDAEANRAFRVLARRTLDRIEGFSRPVIAAIHGWCIGGGTALGWVADLRVAADDARFRAGDAYLGIVPTWGMGLLRLPRLVGRARALDILLLGEDFGAEQAREYGLVTRVVPRAALHETVRAMAERVAAASPQAILATRRAVQFNLRHGWEAAAAYEETLAAQVFAHPDAAEGMAAMLEKRQPVFRNE